MTNKMRCQLLTAERLNSSTNGNPRFRLILSNVAGDESDGHWTHSYVTQSDAACSYEIENYTRKPQPVIVNITLTRANRVSDIELASDEGWRVVCPDGDIKHEGYFATEVEARMFAKAQCSTGKSSEHRIEYVS